MLRFLVWLLILALAVLLWMFWSQFRRALYVRRIERARREFARSRPALEGEFFQAAASSGKPRGLAWKRCDFRKGATLARDRGSGELVGLVGVTISFEAVAGGDMEEVEAVGNLRAATAVFTWNGRRWSTQGRAIFNLEPGEVLDRYGDSLEHVYTEYQTV